MKSFLFSRKIVIDRDRDTDEVKEFLRTTLADNMDVTEMTPGEQEFMLKGSTGAVFESIRKASLNARFRIFTEETKTERELKIIVNGNTNLTWSLTITYIALFVLVLLVGMLPGSIETFGEDSTPLDALIFLLIGLYIKTDIDNSMREAESHLKQALEAVDVRYGT